MRRVVLASDGGSTLSLMPATATTVGFIRGPLDGGRLSIVGRKGPPDTVALFVGNGSRASYIRIGSSYVHLVTSGVGPQRGPCHCGAVMFSVDGVDWTCAAGCVPAE